MLSAGIEIFYPTHSDRIELVNTLLEGSNSSVFGGSISTIFKPQLLPGFLPAMVDITGSDGTSIKSEENENENENNENENDNENDDEDRADPTNANTNANANATINISSNAAVNV